MYTRKSVELMIRVDINDDAIGRSRSERFYFVRSLIKCDRKSKSLKTFARTQLSGVPFNELSCVKLELLIEEHISKNIPKSSKIHDYTCRAHALHDVSNTSISVRINTRAK